MAYILRISAVLLLGIIALALSACSHFFTVPSQPVREAFFECSKCHSLRGGIPTARIKMDTRVGRFCWHRWTPLPSKREFMRRVERAWPGTFSPMRWSLPRTTYWDSPVDAQ
jgi:hypothetical protein